MLCLVVVYELWKMIAFEFSEEFVSYMDLQKKLMRRSMFS